MTSPSPGTIVRHLMRSADRATLATTQRADSSAGPSAAGCAYASLVLVAAAPDGAPLLLLSDLADHTRNLKADSRCSLLYDGTAGLADPLTGPRATVLGRIEVIARSDPGFKPLLGRFVRRHPSAAFYAGFGDFNLYRLVPETAHLVAGFGAIHWLNADAFAKPAADPAALAEAEADVVDHMNEDHGDAVALYANRLLGLSGVGWRLTGVDVEGADLRRGGETARLWFDKPAHDAEGARVELVRLVKRARGKG